MRALHYLAAVTMTVLPAAYADATQRNWVDRYLSSHGHCASFPLFLSTRPLDKPIEDWTDGDLADLKAAFDRCDALPDRENGGGSGKWTGPVYESIAGSVRERQRDAAREEDARISAREIAQQADAARQRRMKADEEATSARLAALHRATEKEAEERKAAEARTAATAEEGKAAEHLAEEAEARAKATKAEARARYGVDAARKRASEAEEQARQADAQARAERQEADKRFADLHPDVAATPKPQADGPAVSSPAEREHPIGATKAEPQSSRTGEPVRTTPALTNTNYVACKMLNELVTSSQAILRGDGDTGAALVNAGECFLIDRGTRVRVKDEDMAGDDPKAVCVVIAGHPQCLWVPTNILEEAS